MRKEPYSENRELMDVVMDETKLDAEAIVRLCEEAESLETVANNVQRWTVFRHIELIKGRANEIIRKMT